MTMPVAVALLAAVAFGLALFVFSYLFNRFYGAEDTINLAQIMRDGYYHADPHPGNVMIDADGMLWLLDFGAVGRIDAISREALQGIALGFSLGDGSLIARAVRHMVGDDEQIDMRQLERDLSVLLGEVQSAGFGPAAMAGVLQHSDFRADPWGRLRRTADYVHGRFG